MRSREKNSFWRWRVVLAAMMAVGVMGITACGGGEKIVWEDIILGDMLPEPPSDKGEIKMNAADMLMLDIYDVSSRQYVDYIEECKEEGFDVDADSVSVFYRAYNTEGYSLSLSHYANDEKMGISIYAPKQNENTEDISDQVESNMDSMSQETSDSGTVSEADPDAAEDTADKGGLDPNFKKAMDSYEAFMDEYVDFMEKYNENPSDLSLLTEYTDYLGRYADFVEDFEKWEDEELNAEETAYYIEVQSRVSKKLLEAAQ